MTYAQIMEVLDIYALAKNRLGGCRPEDHKMRWLCEDVAMHARRVLDEEMRGDRREWIAEKMA